MTKFYCLVVDHNNGASEDFNFNYLNEDNFEIYSDERDRDRRVKFINETLPQLISSVEGVTVEVNEFVAISFDIERKESYGSIPEIIVQSFKDEDYSIDYSETPDGPKLNIVDLFNQESE